MAKIVELAFDDFYSEACRANGVVIDIGPFYIRLKSNVKSFVKLIHFFYGSFNVLPVESFTDFQIEIKQHHPLSRFLRPQVVFISDGIQPFQPFPLSHAFPLFEWGLNWCIARRSHQYLMLHSGVLEKNGRAVILPATPGSGKTTLCAALAMQGWRFLSDEFAILGPKDDGFIFPIPRPAPLKNASIDVIKNEFPAAEIGPLFPKTRKGTVAHFKAPGPSVEALHEGVMPRIVVFPQFQDDVDLKVNKLNKAYAFFKIASNSFNYELMGERGFSLIDHIISSCDCYNLVYSHFDQAIPKLEELIAAPA